VTEEWRVVPGWPYHEVSDLGHFRKKAYRAGNGRVYPAHDLTVHVQRYDRKGHVRSFVSMYGPDGLKTISAGKLVLTAFRGPRPTPKHVARHLDDDVGNNRLINLEWGLQKENVQDAIRNGKRTTYGNGVKTAKLNPEVVAQIKLEYVPWSREFGSKALARKYGVSSPTILAAAKGGSWQVI
jgi:hypothetical protein